MDLLLAILSGAEEAQALFVSTGGLETLLRTVLQQAEELQTAADAAAAALDVGKTSRSGSGMGASDGGVESTDALVVHLLVFLQVLLGWVIGEAVRRGAHPNTQKAAVQLLQQHLGAAAAGKLTSGLSHLVGRNQDVLELMGSKGTGEQGGEVWSEKGEGSLRGRAYEAMALLVVRRSQG